MKEEIKSQVNIVQSGSGYIIEVSDQFITNKIAVTEKELRNIILFGEHLLRNK